MVGVYPGRGKALGAEAPFFTWTLLGQCAKDNDEIW